MGTKVVRIEDIGKELANIRKEINRSYAKTKSKGSKDAMYMMVRTAKAYSPSKSGDTSEGIHGEKYGDGYKVISSVPNSFPQNIWADNRIVGMQSRIPYPSVQLTGITGGGFFTKAIAKTKKEFKKSVLKDISYWELVK